MNVLVLGGTVFFGRHLVAALLARGHRVTTFNRGTHVVDTEFPVTRLIGDRTDPAWLEFQPRAGMPSSIRAPTGPPTLKPPRRICGRPADMSTFRQSQPTTGVSR